MDWLNSRALTFQTYQRARNRTSVSQCKSVMSRQPVYDKQMAFKCPKIVGNCTLQHNFVISVPLLLCLGLYFVKTFGITTTLGNRITEQYLQFYLEKTCHPNFPYPLQKVTVRKKIATTILCLPGLQRYFDGKALIRSHGEWMAISSVRLASPAGCHFQLICHDFA